MRAYQFYVFFSQYMQRKDIKTETFAIAHAAIESGYGSSNLARNHNNFFGLSGRAVRTKDGRHFADYQSPKACIASYQNLIANKYPKALTATSPREYINALILGGYGGKNFAGTQAARAYINQYAVMHSKITAFEKKYQQNLADSCESTFLNIILLLFTITS